MPNSTKDYRVEVKVKNNLLYKAMREEGYYTAAALSRDCGVNQSSIGGYLNLKRAPMNSSGEWNPIYLKLTKFLRRLPEDLCPKAHQKYKLNKNVGVLEMDSNQVQGLIAGDDPERLAIEHQRKDILYGVLDTLRPREAKFIKMRHGLDGYGTHTFKEIGELNGGITVERVRQIYYKAFNKMGHPVRQKALEPLREDIEDA